MKLKAVIFNVAETMSETTDIQRAAFNQVFSEQNLGWVWTRTMFKVISSFAFAGREIEYLTTYHQPNLFAAHDIDDQFADLQIRQSEIYHSLLDAGAAQLRPGIARLMMDVRASGTLLSVCSTGWRDEFESLTFNRLGLEMIDSVATCVTREDMTNPTSTSAYALTLHRLGLEPQEVVAIDGDPAGVNAAVAFGIKTIAVPSAYSAGCSFPGAELVLSDLGQAAAPFRVISGNAGNAGYVSLDRLKMWHGEWVETTKSAA